MAKRVAPCTLSKSADLRTDPSKAGSNHGVGVTRYVSERDWALRAAPVLHRPGGRHPGQHSGRAWRARLADRHPRIRRLRHRPRQHRGRARRAAVLGQLVAGGELAWDDEQARQVLVDALVTDAVALFANLPAQPLGERAANAVSVLALVAYQDVEPAGGSDGWDGRWRIARRTAPDRVVSTVDPESRHVHKNRTRHQDGYKAHLAVEPETGLFTAVALRPGTGADNHEAAIAEELLAGEERAGQPPPALPGHHQEQHLAPRPRRRLEPPYIDPPWAHPRRRRLGSQVSHRMMSSPTAPTKVFSDLLDARKARLDRPGLSRSCCSTKRGG